MDGMSRVFLRFRDLAGLPLGNKLVNVLQEDGNPARLYFANGELQSIIGRTFTSPDGYVDFYAATGRLLNLRVVEPATGVEYEAKSHVVPGSGSVEGANGVFNIYGDRIVNVAPGVDPTDAVTLAQLQALITVGPNPPDNPVQNQLWVQTLS